MSLDTKYRPFKFSDVLGQENTVKIMRRFVATGAGLHQSYLLAGPYGGGKTTVGRILARALLCPTPTPEGDPCDTCESCLSMLATGSSVDFMEVDAATNSGKADVQQITEDIEYSTFSGRRRIYLFDECFVGETVLLTKGGFRTIQALVESHFTGDVLSYDPETGDKTWKPLTNWFDIGSRDVVTLDFDNGVSLTVTLNQMFLTRNRGWVGALDINPDDDIVDFAFEGCP